MSLLQGIRNKVDEFGSQDGAHVKLPGVFACLLVVYEGSRGHACGVRCSVEENHCFDKM